MTWLRDHLQVLLLQSDEFEADERAFIDQCVEWVRAGFNLCEEDQERLRGIAAPRKGDVGSS